MSILDNLRARAEERIAVEDKAAAEAPYPDPGNGPVSSLYEAYWRIAREDWRREEAQRRADTPKASVEPTDVSAVLDLHGLDVDLHWQSRGIVGSCWSCDAAIVAYRLGVGKDRCGPRPLFAPEPPLTIRYRIDMRTDKGVFCNTCPACGVVTPRRLADHLAPDGPWQKIYQTLEQRVRARERAKARR